ncbi:MAG: C69 family dipeptidase [Bacteroidetes bacterium]|nr:C69 family dipeptidase [Bacteroidota bacterium]
MKKIFYLIFFTFSLLMNSELNACTNFLITKGASTDGSTMITYAADSHTLFGELYFTPAADYSEGAMYDVYEWDTGKFLGKIPQVSHTYSVVGNMNEYQVAVGETTYGGIKQLHHQPNALIDYGSLMYLALQRAKTAREAIKVMTELVAEFGYYSEGESFSISDPNEVWVVDMIGKGDGQKGAVWVARLVPDGYVCAHANQARITTFPFQKVNDFTSKTQNTYNSADVISFARGKELFKGKDKDFSFSDTYAPVDFGAARFCEIRVWAMFRAVNSKMDKYFDYAKGIVKKGKNGYATNRMPLWIKPDKKVSVHDVMNLMRDHLEGSELDMTKDIGAGPYGLPYRWRGLTWKVDDVQYCNERATATQQTGFSFVAQSRSWLPNPIGGIFWFSVDDAASSVYTPMYCGMTRIPETYAVGNGNMLKFSENSAFWVFNQVANFAYLKYNVIMKDVRKKQNLLETKYIAYTPAIDKAAVELYNSNKELACEFITDYSVTQGNNTVKEWKEFYQFLFLKYKDGNEMKEENGVFKTNGSGQAAGPNQPGYPEWWYREIIKQTGDQFKVIE